MAKKQTSKNETLAPAPTMPASEVAQPVVPETPAEETPVAPPILDTPPAEPTSSNEVDSVKALPSEPTPASEVKASKPAGNPYGVTYHKAPVYLTEEGKK